MVFDLLIAGGIGTLYGYMKKGRQDKGQLFKMGLLWGAIIAGVLALVGWALGADILLATGGFLALVIGIAILMAAFVGGVFLGDWLEHR